MNGDIVSSDLMSPEQKAKFDRHNYGDDENDGSATKSSGSAAAVSPAPADFPPAPTAAVTPSATTANDTIAPNPPNGMVFAGKGPYQVYRQGNLTWRVDTTTGRSCVLFATEEEWRKQVVASHGCGRAA